MGIGALMTLPQQQPPLVAGSSGIGPFAMMNTVEDTFGALPQFVGGPFELVAALTVAGYDAVKCVGDAPAVGRLVAGDSSGGDVDFAVAY